MVVSRSAKNGGAGGTRGIIGLGVAERGKQRYEKRKRRLISTRRTIGPEAVA